MSKWWMCIAFIGIGTSTDCRKLLEQARRGGVTVRVRVRVRVTVTVRVRVRVRVSPNLNPNA